MERDYTRNVSCYGDEHAGSAQLLSLARIDKNSHIKNLIEASPARGRARSCASVLCTRVFMRVDTIFMSMKYITLTMCSCETETVQNIPHECTDQVPGLATEQRRCTVLHFLAFICFICKEL
jgi:hypothetical protein